MNNNSVALEDKVQNGTTDINGHAQFYFSFESDYKEIGVLDGNIFLARISTKQADLCIVQKNFNTLHKINILESVNSSIISMPMKNSKSRSSSAIKQV